MLFISTIILQCPGTCDLFTKQLNVMKKNEQTYSTCCVSQSLFTQLCIMQYHLYIHTVKDGMYIESKALRNDTIYSAYVKWWLLILCSRFIFIYWNFPFCFLSVITAFLWKHIWKKNVQVETLFIISKWFFTQTLTSSYCMMHSFRLLTF